MSTFFVELQNEELKKEVPEVSCGAVLLGLIKCSSEQSTFLLVPCCFPHRMELSCGVRNEPLVPHVREGGCSSPGLIVSIPVEELCCFYKLRGVAVSSSCVAEVSDVPHGVDGGMTFVEDDEERRAGDTFCQILTVQILLRVELHPVLQLLRDVLVPPLSQVCHNDSWVEGACVGSHAQLLDGLLLKVKETYVVILVSRSANESFGRR